MINKSSTDKVIYLIRHARSAYNAAEHEVEQMYKDRKQVKLEETTQYLKMKWDSNYEDCDIVEQEGRKQCEECRRKMDNIDVDLIIVSPLRRALSTCALVFKDHHSKAPIIVDPMFRQIFESKCDIGSGLRKSMKDYPEFDYSLIQNVDYWYVESMKNEEAKARILQKLQTVPPSDLNMTAQSLMLEYLKQLWNRRKLDDKLHKPEALSPVDTQKEKLKLLLQKYQSIAIVTHSENIKSYTGIKPPNCSIMKYYPTYFELPVDQVPHQYV